MMANNRAMTSSFFKSTYPWLIVCCGMLFYCYNYFLRSSPGFMQSELSQAFHINASQWGMLTAAYYWGYVPMQIPAGLFYDKFGVRFVLALAVLVSVIGLSVFISADTFTTAWMGRFLIGLGTAFAYIGTLKLASVWLPANRLAIAAGLATAAGMSCGALTQMYVSHAMNVIGWKHALQPAIITGVVLSLVIVFLIKDKNTNQTGDNQIPQTQPLTIKQLFFALYTIMKNPQMWLIGAIGCLLYLPASVFQDSFLKNFLTTVYNITPLQAATVSILTSAGWIISGPIIGAYSDKIKRRCMPLTVTGFFAAALLCVPFFIPSALNLWGLYSVFFMAGFCCGAHPLCFPLGKENNPIQISGTAIAFTNMLIMLGGMIIPPIVGKLLDYHSSSIGIDGLPIYNAGDYTFALSIVPLGVALGIALSMFLKETYCESQATEEDERLFMPADEIALQTESAAN
ncbi:MAG: MFS transporter [Gammaproteobacteria bacterium]